MEGWNPYLDTDFRFDQPGSLEQAGVLQSNTGAITGSSVGHYRARTVRPHLQYFDCDLQFPEPLRMHKVLPGSLCIVQVFDGQWQHRVDGRHNAYTTGAPHTREHGGSGPVARRELRAHGRSAHCRRLPA